MMAINPTEVYNAKTGAVALNTSEAWVSKWIARGVQRGLIVEQGKKGSGEVLGSALILICRKFFQDYEDSVRWYHFNKQREREGLGLVSEE
jgi:hypothetical protein